ncbi:hypothetical protein H5410_056132 [Solanum commersonii]|uniref:Uncharacterized protein n=1 Tax=Solanum commersonii TaxID=4109 RepID=A0A9J5WM80_SOLCO|nr:hypothetical protein H5410_056132 [Solanum commersonii]
MVYGIRFYLFCSKADELVVHFMVNSLGFSTKEAISTSAKMKTLVSSSPKLLFCDIDTTLKPKIKVLQPLNLSGSDLVTLIGKSDFLRRALVPLHESTLERKLDIYRSFGWSHSDICTMVRKLPSCLTSSEAKIRITLKFFMNELGIQGSGDIDDDVTHRDGVAWMKWRLASESQVIRKSHLDLKDLAQLHLTEDMTLDRKEWRSRIKVVGNETACLIIGKRGIAEQNYKPFHQKAVLMLPQNPNRQSFFPAYSNRAPYD